MLAPLLLRLVVALALADDPTYAAHLIEKLGAGSFDDRVAVIRALEGLGHEALPALRAAAETSDPRIRVRVRALIESIGRQVEHDRFGRSTMLSLDFQNRPLGEVVDALNDRHDLGLTLRLGPETRQRMMILDPTQPQRLKELKSREITLEASRPLPFWEAIDSLCRAGSLRYDQSSRIESGITPGLLYPIADRTARGPISDSGPFRVQMTEVQTVFERDLTLEPVNVAGGVKPMLGGALTMTLAVRSEPSLMLHLNGPVLITDASDDRGRSLKPQVAAEPNLDRAYQSGRIRNGNEPISASAFLVVPDPPGTVIRQLRGRVPVIAVARSSDPIVLPLLGEGAVGRLVSTRDMTLVVDQVSLTPRPQTSVQVTIRDHRSDLATTARPDPQRPDFAAFNRDRLLEHMALYDATGRRLNHNVNGQMRGADGRGFYDRYTLTVSPVAENGPADGSRKSTTLPPAELRYYGFVQQVMDVPFEFRDIPMP